MNEPLRQALLQSVASTAAVNTAVEAELRGASPQRRIEAAKQLQAALRIHEED